VRCGWGGWRGRLRCGGWGWQHPLAYPPFFLTRLPSSPRCTLGPPGHSSFCAVAHEPNIPIFGVSVNQPRAPLFRVVWPCLASFCGHQPSFFTNSLAFRLVTDPRFVAGPISWICHPLITSSSTSGHLPFGRVVAPFDSSIRGNFCQPALSLGFQLYAQSSQFAPNLGSFWFSSWMASTSDDRLSRFLV
jgi:hypothetical protein